VSRFFGAFNKLRGSDRLVRVTLVSAATITSALVVGAFLLVTVNVIRYERASICGVDSLQGCIQVVPGVITDPSRHKVRRSCGGPASYCQHIDYYSIVVTPQGSSHRVELWDSKEHPDFRVGDLVSLERWGDEYIAVTNHGQRVVTSNWNLIWFEWVLGLAVVFAVIIAVYWLMGRLGCFKTKTSSMLIALMVGEYLLIASILIKVHSTHWAFLQLFW
jgi:hypothetical protein